MNNKIDFRLIVITGSIAIVSILIAWSAILVFRYLFPQLAAETIWDELAGLPIAALISFGVKSFLLREHVFHLMVTMDLEDVHCVNLEILRRRDGLGLLFMPMFFREAIIYEKINLVRNITWWGVYGVDECRLRFCVPGITNSYYSIQINNALLHSYATANIKLSEITGGKVLCLTEQHLESEKTL